MTGNEASFTLPSAVVKGKASDGMFCSRIFLLCTPLKYNYAIPSTDMGTLFLILANTETLCGRPQDILLLKGTKHQLSLFSNVPMVRRLFYACLTFRSSSCSVTDGGFEKRRIRDCITLPHK